MVDAYTTIAGAIERARCYEQCSLSQNTLSPTKLPVKSSASLPLKMKSNDQSNSSLRRDSAPIESTKPITWTEGKFAMSAYQLLEKFGRPVDTIILSIKPVPLDLKLHTSRPPLPMRPPYFISESLLGIRADQELENVSKYASMVDVIVDANL